MKRISHTMAARAAIAVGGVRSAGKRAATIQATMPAEANQAPRRAKRMWTPALKQSHQSLPLGSVKLTGSSLAYRYRLSEVGSFNCPLTGSCWDQRPKPGL